MGIIFHCTFPQISRIFAALTLFRIEAMTLKLHCFSYSDIAVPVSALSLYAIAAGYLMSLLPLTLPYFNLASSLAGWLASSFYAGVLIGALCCEPLVKRWGYSASFALCLIVLMLSIIALPLFPVAWHWLINRFIAGIVVAGIFVIVESWLLYGDEAGRAKRLGIYMTALYGGTALGQLGIQWIGVSGYLPFISIVSLLSIATAVLFFGKAAQPQASQILSLSLKQISQLNHAALLGSAASGVALGAIYGLMPLELAHRQLSESLIGGLMAIVILGGMLVQLLIPYLSRYIERAPQLLLWAFLGSISCLLPFLFAHSLIVLAVSLFVLGMAGFALYPVAINLVCEHLPTHYLVSATQVMLLCFSAGSIFSPALAAQVMQQHSLLIYLFVALFSTCLYLLISQFKIKQPWVTGK